MPKVLYFGKMQIKEGDCLSILVSGRTYVIKVTEITDYNQIIGEDIAGNPVMIRVGKIMALKKIPPDEYERRRSERNETK